MLCEEVSYRERVELYLSINNGEKCKSGSSLHPILIYRTLVKLQVSKTNTVVDSTSNFVLDSFSKSAIFSYSFNQTDLPLCIPYDSELATRTLLIPVASITVLLAFVAIGIGQVVAKILAFLFCITPAVSGSDGSNINIKVIPTSRTICLADINFGTFVIVLADSLAGT